MKLIFYTFEIKKNIGILGYESLGCIKLMVLRATINQKYIYLIGYYAISGFEWNQLYRAKWVYFFLAGCNESPKNE